MGTALTMSMMAEVLGIMLSGASTVAHDDVRLIAKANETGSRIVEMVWEGINAERILTPESFRRALLALAALGGSTNAIIHLCAIAGRLMVPLPLEDFDKAAQETPVLADVAPIGAHTIAAFDAAGGVQAVLAELEQVAPPSTLPSGSSFRAEKSSGFRAEKSQVIRSRKNPVTGVPAFAVVKGNLAPDGAVIKTAAASAHLMAHTGPAVVFRGYDDMLGRIDDPGLDVSQSSVLILTGCGPRGGDGFPEWGMIPIPKKLAEQGVTDMVRISDARMSGTSFGTCVLHVAPEAAVGGPLGGVEDGDMVTLDVSRRLLAVDVAPRVLEERIARQPKQPQQHHRGWPALYQEHVLQAHRGADFDFLVPGSTEQLQFVDPKVGRS